ncbi:MAG: pyridoxal-phosphate dependent enzyme [Bergeyella sp.]|nr:pyridoxal-phosphate dependent enzyme [Bergeyella sp.]
MFPHEVPIIEIPYGSSGVRMFIKREDLVHPDISGNKFWKLFYPVKNYLEKKVESPLFITFGGAFSNHIAATAVLGKLYGIPSLGIIRGEELATVWEDNPTLSLAKKNGMRLVFVSRRVYTNKSDLMQVLEKKYPQALILPEGGSSASAVKGMQHMLGDKTQGYDYLCTAVGTGGTLSGLSLYAEKNQKVVGYCVTKDRVIERIESFTHRRNYALVEASQGGYGKVSDALVDFINHFFYEYKVILDPLYTGKMMMKIFQMIDKRMFPLGSKILVFHTGGVQGIGGINQARRKKKKKTINIAI